MGRDPLRPSRSSLLTPTARMVDCACIRPSRPPRGERRRPRAISLTEMPERQLHLLEVGLTWPLDTFLVDKLEGLAARGIRVTVAAVGAPRYPSSQLHGVELLPQPHWD